MMSDTRYSMAQLHRRLFRVEMDLCDHNGRTFGALVLLKNQAVAPVSHYTLGRIEHLRRSILKALERIDGNQSQGGQSQAADLIHSRSGCCSLNEAFIAFTST